MVHLRSLIPIAMLPVFTACSVATDSEENTDEPDTVSSVSEPITGSRALLVVLMRRADGAALAHNWSWYNDRIFGVSGGRNIVSYFSAMSGGRFTYSRGSVLSVKDPETAAFDARAGVTSTDDAATVHAKRGRVLAADVGLDYSAFDANGNGWVTEKELTILVIHKYLQNSGFAPSLPCMKLAGVDVCGPVATAGHQSELSTYAHELAHTLSPSAVDLYGAFNNAVPPVVPCYSRLMTLQSCGTGILDDAAGVFMDPWHRALYGWVTARRTVILSGVSSGSQTLVPVGEGFSGTESLELVGPNSESVTFEFRTNTNAYDDAVAAENVIAWYRKAKSNGEPADIPSIQPNTTKKDKALFTLAPVSCTFRPNSLSSRGKVAGLTGGSYRMRWADGTDSGFLFTVTPGFLSYDVSWQRTSAAPSC
jgi:M6 family metalloprotease-like protein